MTIYETAVREKQIVDHIDTIMRRHPESATRREAISALRDRLDRLRVTKNFRGEQA